MEWTQKMRIISINVSSYLYYVICVGQSTFYEDIHCGYVNLITENGLVIILILANFIEINIW